MGTVTYAYDPGTTVHVLIAGDCPATFVAKSGVINRVEIKINQSTPTPITIISYIITTTDDNVLHAINEADVFVDKPTAVAAAMTRYQATFI